MHNFLIGPYVYIYNIYYKFRYEYEFIATNKVFYILNKLPASWYDNMCEFKNH